MLSSTNVPNDRAIYLNSQTGEIAGSMDISQFAGDNSNFHATADRGNNILFCSYTPSGGTFTVWKANGVNEKPQKYIEYKTGTNIITCSITTTKNNDSCIRIR